MIVQLSTENPQLQHAGTLHDFIAARLPEMHNAEAMEAFGEELYHAVTQIVTGNRDWFTAESIHKMPLLTKFDLPKIFKWTIQFNLWFDDLSDFEQIALHNAKFIWV
jgi:hypothetical protein